ncbi:DUF4974 domain-containing protein [uncultured Duncaniella sp.]|uniref:DUF4974 domain-containing protein n=1 Tax=uncultured Duncaniella sp. TaxID=2768039 RepID=UPI0026ED3037|nr:DUF4974 domain-containing protein [uncultured Duncaniella sp.]
MKDRTDQLFEAIENPDHFSDEEIQEMLDDSGIQELYRQICKTADALTTTEEPDIDLEWEQFVSRQKKPVTLGFLHSIRAFFNRNVAAVLLCTVASLVVVAATFGVSYSLSNRAIVTEVSADIASAPDKSVSGANLAKDSVQVDESIPEEPRIVIFKDKSFEEMISSIADFYGVSVVYKNEKSKELRLYFQWDQSLPLNEIVEQLNNFEQIKTSISDKTITIE